MSSLQYSTQLLTIYDDDSQRHTKLIRLIKHNKTNTSGSHMFDSLAIVGQSL